MNIKMQFTCERCGDDFTCKRNLIGHLSRQKECVANGDNAPTRETLLIKVTTKVINDINFPCKKCHQKFNTKSSMYKHSSKCKIEPQARSKEESLLKIQLEQTLKKLKTLETEHKKLLDEIQRIPEENKPINLVINIVGKDKGLPKKKIPQALRIACWDKWIGKHNGTNLCLCCNQQTISTFSFHCGHVVAECHGGDLSLHNLRPVCSDCNLSMGSMNMNEFAKQYFNREII